MRARQGLPAPRACEPGRVVEVLPAGVNWPDQYNYRRCRRTLMAISGAASATSATWCSLYRSHCGVVLLLLCCVSRTSGVETLGGKYELHDLVQLDAHTAGVIVGIDKDTARVLTNQSTLQKNDIRYCKVSGTRAGCSHQVPTRAGNARALSLSPCGCIFGSRKNNWCHLPLISCGRLPWVIRCVLQRPCLFFLSGPVGVCLLLRCALLDCHRRLTLCASCRPTGHPPQTCPTIRSTWETMSQSWTHQQQPRRAQAGRKRAVSFAAAWRLCD